MRVYLSSDTEITKEYFFSKNPLIQRVVIWIIGIFVLTAILWATFAKFEEVVKVSGLIRPTDNISSVSNAVTGRIQSVGYTKGQRVTKGQLLLSIDPTQLESQKEALLVELEHEKLQLDYLNAIHESINQNKNVIPKELSGAYLRYSVWEKELRKLNEVQRIKKRAWDNERKLPSSMTTIEKLKNLESEYYIAKNDYDNTNLSFKHDISSELESYSSSYSIKSAQLKQIEDALLFTKIKSPIDGVIQEKRELNANDWIQAGEALFNIVPIEDVKNKVEVYIPAKKAGKVKVGMKVKMRFPSLPYNEFGDCEGTILTIDPDVTQNNQGEAFFLVVTNMNKDKLEDKNGVSFPLKVGLQADVRIILSKKSLLLFLLEKMDLWY